MKIKLLFIYCFTILSVLSCHQNSFGENPEQVFEQCTKYLNDGNNDIAIKCFTELLDSESSIDNYNKSIIYYTRGLAYSKNGEREKSIRDYSKSIEFYPYYPDAYLNRGNDNILLENYEKAIDDFTQDIAMRPNSFFAYNSRAYAYYYLSKYDNALSDINIAIKLNDNYYKAYRTRSKINFAMNNLEMAMKDIQIALKINPQDNRSYKLRSEIYYQTKQYKNAIDDLLEAIKLNSKQFQYYNDAAWILATCPDKTIRNGKKAIHLSKQAVELNKNSMTMNTLAAAYAENNDFLNAIQYANIAVDLISKESNPELLVKYKQHLETYKKQIPWREN